jgi:hypothetical protein
MIDEIEHTFQPGIGELAHSLCFELLSLPRQQQVSRKKPS